MGKTLVDRLLQGRRERAGRRFDARHGVETSERVNRQKLSGMVSALRDHAGEYVASSPDLFRRILRKSGVDLADFAFIDLGCGKGRAVILATSYPFREVVGVEADSHLFEGAQANLRQSGLDRRATLVHADASSFDPPAGDLFIYMYSPFRGPVFERLAGRLGALACEPGRAVVIAYSSDFESPALERTGMFTRVRLRRRQFWAPPSVSFFYNPAADAKRRIRAAEGRGGVES